MKLKKSDLQNLSRVLMYGSVASVVLATIGYLGIDIWLASTQWVLVAAVLAIFGLYLKK